jgi:hypothetical protein
MKPGDMAQIEQEISEAEGSRGASCWRWARLFLLAI